MFRLFKKKKSKTESNTDDVTSELLEEASQDTIEESLLDEPVDVAEFSDDLESQNSPEASTALKENTIKETSTNEIAPESLPDNHVDDEAVTKEQAEPNEPEIKKEGLFSRLRTGLSKTGNALTEGMGALVLGKKKIDEDILEELETRLLMADVGIEATQRIINDLTKRAARDELNDSNAMMKAMYVEMTKILRPIAKPLIIDETQSPTVILMVGINGAGKTTTIGKLAKQFQNDGKSVMLAAGDTFRAAAVEQLEVWGERNNIPVIAQGTGSDSASVIYDAMESAKAKNIDILLADTAGRLHTQTNLMEELKKVKRVMQKIDENAPHEIMLIVDASIGQNALAQAKEFNSALGLTGITVTKLDGTAKGGILFAIAEQTGIPIRYIGVGESIDDLQEFDAYEFSGALLAGED